MITNRPTWLLTDFLFAVVIGLWAADCRAQQDGVELQLRIEVTAEYEEYLDDREAALRAQIAAGDDVNAARMALAIVLLARLQVEADRVGESLAENRGDAVSSLEDLLILIDDEIAVADPRSLSEFIDAVNDRFVDGIDPDVEEELNQIGDDLNASGDDASGALFDFADESSALTDEMQTLLDELRASEAPFVVTVHLLRGDSETTVRITRDDLDAFDSGQPSALDDLLGLDAVQVDDLDAAADDLAAARDNLERARAMLDSALSQEDNREAIDVIRAALANLDSALADAERVAIELPGLSVSQLGDLVIELDSLFSGQTFAAGDMTVRPAALLENRSGDAELRPDLAGAGVTLLTLAQTELRRAETLENDGELGRAEKARLRGWVWVMLGAGSLGLTDPPETLMLEFYAAADPASHTFRGYFPEGLSPAMMELIGVDLIVNTSASQEQFENYLRQRQAQWRERVTPGDGDGDAEARAGLAIARTYFLVSDNRRDFTDLVDLAAGGDIIAFVDRLETEDFDYTASADSTERDIDAAIADEDILFLIVNKRDDDGAPFVLQLDDSITPIPLVRAQLAAGLERVRAAAISAAGVSASVNTAFGDADRSFELDLDPNELDFSNADTGLEVAEALERSNENFLRITSTGRDHLVTAGDDIEAQLGGLSSAVTSLREFLEEIEESRGVDLGGLANGVGEFDDFYQELRHDFESEAGVSRFGGRDVNFSAWFDHPPERLLQRFIWYLDDDDETDNTLAGLFPDPGVESVIVETRQDRRPDALQLYQNVPNPFNSGTVIEFDLSERGPVALTLHNILGERVLTLVSGVRAPGSYRILWDGRDDDGVELASGTYLYRLATGRTSTARRLMLLR